MTTSTTSETRERLLEATLAELAEHGHAGISLRAVARRAGLSHAAPKHHFEDRAGLLTATATQGFRDLTAAQEAVEESDPARRLAALGRAYVDFGLAHPALFDLMFRPIELHTEDPGLQQAQAASIQGLAEAAAGLHAPGDLAPATLTVMAWALVHGLVVLVRDGALRDPTDAASPEPGALAHEVVTAFSRTVGR